MKPVHYVRPILVAQKRDTYLVGDHYETKCGLLLHPGTKVRFTVLSRHGITCRSCRRILKLPAVPSPHR